MLKFWKGLVLSLVLSIIIWVVIIATIFSSVFAQELSKSDLSSDSKLQLTTAKLSMSKLDSKSMQFDSTVCSFKAGNLMELKTSANAIKFGFTEPDVITCTNLVKCEGHKTWTTEDKWLYWNPVWLMTGYNSGLDEEGKLYMTPSFSNLVSISCTCKKEETRYYDECTPAVYDEKEPEKVKIPESCKTVSYKKCVLSDAVITVSTDHYDPTYEANSAPVITAISQSTPTGLFYDYENITGSLTVTDTDSTDRIYNYTMYSEASGWNTTMFMPGEQPFPTDVSGNALTMTTSGFTTYDGVLGNATVGDAAEPTIVQGKYGRGMGFDGTDDIINVSHNNAFAFNESFTIMAWVNISSFNTTGSNGGIICKGTGYNSEGMYCLESSGSNVTNGAFQFRLLNTSGQGVAVNTGFLFKINTNYHLAGRFEKTSGKLSLYVSGINYTSSFLVSTGYYNSLPLYIGYNQRNARYINASMIDNVALYPCYLTTEQISFSMLSPYPIDFSSEGGCAPTLSYSFESVSSGYVNDTSMQVSDGHGGGAYKCDNSGSITSSTMSLKSNFTFSLNIDNFNISNAGGLFSFGATSKTNLYELYFDITNGYCLRSSWDGDWLNYAVCISKTANFDMLHFVHFDNGTTLVYTNGSRFTVGTKLHNYSSTSTLKICKGSWDSDKSQYLLDNLKIYNYALSDSQILLDYQAWQNNRTSNVLSSDMTSTGQTWRYCARSGDFALRSAYNCSTPQTILESCYANLVNTTWNYFNSSCKFNTSSNYYDYNRSRTTYDSNNCMYFSNVTFWEYNYTVQEGCDYCIPVISHNETGFMTQESCKSYNYIDMNNTLVYYDTLDCYSLTSLISDQYNLTYEYVYKNQSCIVNATCNSILDIDNITEENTMLALLFLPFAMLFLGYWMVKNWEKDIGFVLMVGAGFPSFYNALYFNAKGGNYVIFSVMFIALMLVIALLLATKIRRK